MRTYVPSTLPCILASTPVQADIFQLVNRFLITSDALLNRFINFNHDFELDILADELKYGHSHMHIGVVAVFVFIFKLTVFNNLCVEIEINTGFFIMQYFQSVLRFFLDPSERRCLLLASTSHLHLSTSNNVTPSSHITVS
jgi:hypothetical protein